MSKDDFGKSEHTKDIEGLHDRHRKTFSVSDLFGRDFFRRALRHGDGLNRDTLAKLLVSLIVVSVLSDPFIFYLPVVNEDSNCLRLDNNLRIIVVVFRTFADGVYIHLWGFHKIIDGNTPFSSMVVIPAILPFPQAIIYSLSWRLLTVELLKIVTLIQFVPRVYLTIKSYHRAKRRTYMHNIGKSVWLIAVFYLLMFILASNVLGAFWYLRAIERNIDCWKKACEIYGQCKVSSLYCSGSPSNNKYLEKLCPIPPAQNSTFFNYGIYQDAFEKDIIGTHTSFLHKHLYCLWWGLQNLSSLGQNLDPSTYIWDNLYVILIIISGLVLLALLIGNMQVYLQKETGSEWDKKNMRMTVLCREMTTYAPFNSLPAPVIKKVAKCDDPKWLETTQVNLESLLNNLPAELLKDISKHLRRDLFSTAGDFEKLPDVVKDALRERAKVRVFPENTVILEEGNLVYEMLHIIHGKALDYNKGAKINVNQLETKQCFGEEVLRTALDVNSLETTLPVARKTLRSVKRVEAFALSFDDFVDVFTKYGNLVPGYKEKWAKHKIAAATWIIVKMRQWKRSSQQAQVDGCRRFLSCFRDC